MSLDYATEDHVLWQTVDMLLSESLMVELYSYIGIYFVIILSGKVYLYMKEIERAHQPARMWEKIRLSNSYDQALKQVCNF